jgi:mevalonate kinase
VTSAFGKCILVGEHAVVYGHPALAGALTRGVTCTAKEADETTLEVPAWGLAVTAGPASDHPAARALHALMVALDSPCPLSFRAHADVPAGVGLGSSAALAVACVRAAAVALGRDVTDEEVEATAGAAERVFHARPSGVDVALAARGGLGVYQTSRGYRPLTAPPVPVAIGLTGEPRQSSAMVTRVADAMAALPGPTEGHLDRISRATERAIDAVTRGDFVELGAAMTRAHGALTALGVSTDGIERLIAAARGAGAIAAKLTGAGGGGAVVALVPGTGPAVLSAWRALGCDGFLADLGERAQGATR